MECVATIQSAGVPFLEIWQLGRDTRHVPDGLEYLKGGRLDMDWDSEGQSRWYDITSLQTVPCHIVGIYPHSVGL